MPGVAPSAALIVPELSLSFQTRLPRLNAFTMPKSTVRFERASPPTPWPGPLPRSPVGSEPGPIWIVPVAIGVVDGSIESTPLSSKSTSEFGSPTVVVDDISPTSAPAPVKFDAASSTW